MIIYAKAGIMILSLRDRVYWKNVCRGLYNGVCRGVQGFRVWGYGWVLVPLQGTCKGVIVFQTPYRGYMEKRGRDGGWYGVTSGKRVFSLFNRLLRCLKI